VFLIKILKESSDVIKSILGKFRQKIAFVSYLSRVFWNLEIWIFTFLIFCNPPFVIQLKFPEPKSRELVIDGLVFFGKISFQEKESYLAEKIMLVGN